MQRQLIGRNPVEWEERGLNAVYSLGYSCDGGVGAQPARKTRCQNPLHDIPAKVAGLIAVHLIGGALEHGPLEGDLIGVVALHLEFEGDFLVSKERPGVGELIELGFLEGGFESEEAIDFTRGDVSFDVGSEGESVEDGGLHFVGDETFSEGIKRRQVDLVSLGI